MEHWVGRATYEDGFAQYMLNNANEVRELCDLVLFGGNW